VIELGDVCKEEITGYVGTVVAKCEYLWECIQFGLQRKVGKDGKVDDFVWFDQSRLKVIKKGGTFLPLKTKVTGGPTPRY